MSIYGSAVRRPITTIMIFVGLLVLGGYSLNKLPIDFYPEIDFPAISVITTYSGVAPEDIEQSITRPIEQLITTVPNVKEVKSISQEGFSIILVDLASFIKYYSFYQTSILKDL